MAAGRQQRQLWDSRAQYPNNEFGGLALSVSNILGFSIARGTGLGYLSVGLGTDKYGLMEINLQNGHVVKTVTLGVAGSLACSPDGGTLYLAAQFASGSGYGALYSIDRQTLTVNTSTAGVYPEDLSLSPDGRCLSALPAPGSQARLHIVSTAHCNRSDRSHPWECLLT